MQADQPKTYNHILKILDYFKKDILDDIVKSLSLNIYYEDQTVTICGQNFVIDIYIKEDKMLSLTFLEESYSEYFVNEALLLDFCLRNKEMKLFYQLLKYFASFDLENEPLREKIIEKKLIRVSKGINVCDCILKGQNYCCSGSFTSLISKGKKYCMFSHIMQEIIDINNFVYCFRTKNDAFIIFNECFEFNKIENVKSEISRNHLFYSQVSEDFKYGDEYFEIIMDDNIYRIRKDMSFYIVEKDKEKMHEGISFLLKRGIPYKKAIKYFVEI
ncbi:hypothetical protein EDEG_02545 [Edhazardia aedis USNM 41457]|uniref:Uncharacterized protein n=1 Tax=Edhazardia aedis (strain USNM 41457) TaxID=1003232 RepID=J9D5N3_EDHAE|nr:hypothetical protein EDEG_02545 [Edhazardia aedis USNM 41457]|eukprot:EJW03066.1 hypothetical protein EDEG_02545 [Edhazardia aedis USNM 41457]